MYLKLRSSLAWAGLLSKASSAMLTGKAAFRKLRGLAHFWMVVMAPSTILLSLGLLTRRRTWSGSIVLPGPTMPRLDFQSSLRIGGTTPLCMWPEMK